MFLICAICAASYVQTDSSIVALSELRSYFEAQRQSIANKTIEFSVTDFGGQGGEAIANSLHSFEADVVSDLANDAFLLYSANWRTHERSDGSFLFEKEYSRTSPEFDFLRGQKMLLTWDGSQARMKSVPTDANRFGESAMIIDAQPVLEQHVELFNTWQGRWAFQCSGKWSFLDLIDGHSATSRQDGGCTIWSIVVDFQGTRSIYEIAASKVGQAVTIPWMQLSLYRHINDDNPAATSRITFSPAEPALGVLLAASAEVLNVLFDPDKEYRVRSWQLEQIRLMGISNEQLVDTLFRPGVDRNSMVTDRRYRIAYKIGDDSMVLDGRKLYTDAPIDSEIADNLYSWVSTGSFVPLQNKYTGEFIPNALKQPDPPSKIRYLALLLGCGMASLAIVIALKRPKIRNMKSLLPLCCTLFTVQVELAGCNRDPGTLQAETPQLPQIGTFFDYGFIYIDDGPVTLQHVFEVVNDTKETLKISRIVKSCGCVAAVLDKDAIEPGATGHLKTSLDVHQMGTTTQTATLIFDNGKIQQYRIAAYGRTRGEFSIILKSGFIESSSNTLLADLIYIDHVGDGASDVINILSPAGVRAGFAGFEVLEHRDLQGNRPTRQIGTVTLDFSEYSGSFPVIVRMALSNGKEAMTRVLGTRALNHAGQAAAAGHDRS